MKNMMMRIVLFLLTLLPFVSSMGQTQEHFFADQVLDDYFIAYDLNEKKEYVKAFDVLKKVESEINNSLSQKHMTSDMLY